MLCLSNGCSGFDRCGFCQSVPGYRTDNSVGGQVLAGLEMCDRKLRGSTKVAVDTDREADGLNTPRCICHGARARYDIRIAGMVGLNGDQYDCVNWRLHIGAGIACFDASFHFLSFDVDCR